MASYEVDHIEIINGEEVAIVYIDNEDIRPMLFEFDEDQCIIHEYSDNENEHSDNEDQYGGGEEERPYTLENTKQRHIAKFNVHGTEYRLRIPRLQADVGYAEAVEILHDTLHGKSCSSQCLSL